VLTPFGLHWGNFWDPTFQATSNSSLLPRPAAAVAAPAPASTPTSRATVGAVRPDAALQGHPHPRCRMCKPHPLLHREPHLYASCLLHGLCGGCGTQARAPGGKGRPGPPDAGGAVPAKGLKKVRFSGSENAATPGKRPAPPARAAPVASCAGPEPGRGVSSAAAVARGTARHPGRQSPPARSPSRSPGAVSASSRDGHHPKELWVSASK
jgi:hypothetical protein